jgi:hypothetical protein
MLRNRFDVFSEYRDGVMELFDQPGQEYSRDRWRAGQPVPVCELPQEPRIVGTSMR